MLKAEVRGEAEVYARDKSCVCDGSQLRSRRGLDLCIARRSRCGVECIAIVTWASVEEVWGRPLYRKRRGPCYTMALLW